MLSLPEQMSDNFYWRKKYHAWPCPSHDTPHLLALPWSIAMGAAILARRFSVLPMTAVKAALTVVDKSGVHLIGL